MNCPNCNYSILEGNICRKCGIDVVLFDKTIKISDVLYNKGLNLAKVRDLWGAADSLTKSIQFNKNNYYARNLLGLVYYETGKIGDALKQWVISASLINQDNPATKYIAQVQRESKQLDMFDDAIDMYNNALQYIQQKSDDMAIIQLKKALELSPNFVDAMNLLTFCYLIQKEKTYATILVEKALEIDINNPIALNYFKEINPQKARPNVTDYKKEPIKPQTPTAPTGQTMLTNESRRKLFGNNFYFAEIFCFLIGGLCSLALIYTLIMPGTITEKDTEIATLKDQLSAAQDTSSGAAKDNMDKIMLLETDNIRLEKENAELLAQVEIETKEKRITAANNQYDAGNYVDAASMLYSLTPAGLSETELAAYEELKDKAYTKAGSELYSLGYSKFNTGENEEARRAFETCVLYAPSDSNYLDDVTFFLGQIAEEEGDISRAKDYYRSVVESYQGSDRVAAANARLSELE